jgi:ATP-dependent DNA helicase RecG
MTLSIREMLDRLNEVDESHDIEAKRSESEVGKSALETISAFANEPHLGGGYLLFGAVEDEAAHRFVARGVKDPKKTEQEVSSLCAGAFNRTIRPKVWAEVIDGASLVAAFIPEAAPPEKPVFIKSRGMAHGAFRRIGSTDQRCTEDDLRALFQLADIAPYEDAVVRDAAIDDIDEDAVASYRRAIIEANPATGLRDASFVELIQSLGGAKRVDGQIVPTVAGVLLFGKRLALRRFYPALRVDYIRVPGTEWVPDADRRYESIEVREPMLVAFRRVYNAIIDDLPKSFSLEPGSPERKDRLVLPESTVREVLVNALTHRDYRVACAVQVIRYQDRIEIRNPGYSLVDDDLLGEPGSVPRNPRIADVFREMHLAENKGTGIAAVRRAMRTAALTPPIFESDRTRNSFVTTLWLHNLLDGDDVAWLGSLAGAKLSAEQAKAMVLARHAGSVSNAALRAISGLDTLSASVQLRQLRDQRLLDPRGKGSATHYVLGSAAIEPQRQGLPDRNQPQAGGLGPNTRGLGANTRGLPDGNQPQTGKLGAQTGKLEAQTGKLGAQTGELGPKTGGLGPNARGLGANTRGLGPNTWGYEPPIHGAPGGDRGVPTPEQALLRKDLPSNVLEMIDGLGDKPRRDALRGAVMQLCQSRWWTARDLAIVLGRMDAAHLARRHLSPLVDAGHLVRLHPENPGHPKQAYRAVQPPGGETEKTDETR